MPLQEQFPSGLSAWGSFACPEDLIVCVCMCVNTEDRVTDFLFLFWQPEGSVPKSGSLSKLHRTLSDL